MTQNQSFQRPGKSAGTGLGAGGTLVAAVIIALFGLALLGFGQAMFRAGDCGRETAQQLLAGGQDGMVDDARANIGRGQDGTWHVYEMKLAFTGSDGVAHSLSTNHFPRFSPPINAEPGWTSDFPTKQEVVGQHVKYRLGDQPAVELVGELPGLAAAPRTFANYLGLALGALGIAALLGAAAVTFRSFRKSRQLARA